MTGSITFEFCLVLALCSSGYSQQTTKPLYRSPDAPIQDRVQDLLNRMTLEEKVAQLESFTNKPVLPGMHLETAIEGDHLNEAVVKKYFANGIGTYAFMDEFAGSSGDAHSGAEHRNLLQTWVLNEYTARHTDYVPRRGPAWRDGEASNFLSRGRRLRQHLGSRLDRTNVLERG